MLLKENHHNHDEINLIHPDLLFFLKFENNVFFKKIIFVISLEIQMTTESHDPIGALIHAPTLSYEILVENNENFIYSHYHGISVLIREKDGYINVGKLCADFSKVHNVRRNYYGFKRGGRFKRLENHWITQINKDQTKVDYEIKGHKRTLGTYIHPDFIHFVAEWLSEEYAFKVMFIMKEINRRAHLKNIDAETNFQEVLQELKDANDKIEELNKINHE
jgi:hypothetical protein